MSLPELSDKKRAWYILQGYDTIASGYGKRSWWLNGRRHRHDGPAIEWEDGTQYWFLNGELHREDDPAYEGADGYKEWWINGEEFTEKEFTESLLD